MHRPSKNDDYDCPFYLPRTPTYIHQEKKPEVLTENEEKIGELIRRGIQEIGDFQRAYKTATTGFFWTKKQSADYSPEDNKAASEILLYLQNLKKPSASQTRKFSSIQDIQRIIVRTAYQDAKKDFNPRFKKLLSSLVTDEIINEIVKVKKKEPSSVGRYGALETTTYRS